MLLWIVLLLVGLFLLCNRSFKLQTLLVGCVGLFKDFPGHITLKNLWLWFFLVHTALLIAASVEVALLPNAILFKGLLTVVDMPWAYGLIMVNADNPDNNGDLGLFISFMRFGFFYWGGIGLLPYLIAKKIVRDERADERVVFSFVRRAHSVSAAVDNRPALFCSICEAENNPDFKLCWQCQAALGRKLAPGDIQIEKTQRHSIKLLIVQLSNLSNIFSPQSVHFAVLFIPSSLMARLASELNGHFFRLPSIVDFALNDFLITAFITSAWFYTGPVSLLKENKHERLDLAFGLKNTVGAFVPAIVISLLLVAVALVLGVPLFMFLKKFELVSAIKSITVPVGLLSTVLLNALAQGVAYRFLYGDRRG